MSADEFLKRDSFLPFARPTLEDEEIKAVCAVLGTDWISMGPKTIEFEEKVKDICKVKEAVAVNSCTAGLHITLEALGIGKEDEVITTPLTFASTANTIVHVGAKPVFADIQEDTFNIDPKKIAEKITDRTKAIVPVHYGGHPCDMDSIMKIAKENGLMVIEDSAHALGASYKGRPAGTIGNAGVFSFYATKNATAGEGGMITTDDTELANKLRMLRMHGIDKDAWKRYDKTGGWYYEIKYAGYKYNMSDVLSSIAIEQVKKLERFNKARADIVSFYNERFKDVAEIRIPVHRENIKHTWHLYPILIQHELLDIDRGQFIEELKNLNIGASVHYIPLHLHPFYQNTYGYKKGDFPVTEDVYDRLISLPIYPKLTDEDREYVVNAVKKIIGEHRK